MNFFLHVFIFVNLIHCYDVHNFAGFPTTPLMGWRNWNFFAGSITQDLMEAQMRAQAGYKRPVWGLPEPASLVDVGYIHNGLDDAWQACHTGVDNSFHDKSGHPLVNLTRFPSMKQMVDLGHSLNMSVGFYDNNCICNERLSRAQAELDVEGNVKYIIEAGFDGLKADGCGAGINMTRLVELLKASSVKKIFVENCHYDKVPAGQKLPKGAIPDSRNRIFPYWKNNITGGELVCPENSFRVSGDIRNFWSSWFGNLKQMAPFIDLEHPISQPGCWAYADMLMVGVFASKYNPQAGNAASVAEWRSHFGAWAISSSPLVLSFDMTNHTTMESVWPFITNIEAIQINQEWHGHPGRPVASPTPAAMIWTKPLSRGRQAIFIVNDDRKKDLSFNLDIRSISKHLSPNSNVRDVWEHKDIDSLSDGVISVKDLAPHDSRFLIVSPHTDLS